MAVFTNGTWTPGGSTSRITTPVNSDVRSLQASFNALCSSLSGVLSALGGADTAMTTATLSIGTTVTLASTASVIAINGVSAAVPALTAQAFGALGTIPASKFGIIGVERVLAGTCTFTSGAANYSTGYDTAALALAALPAQTADKVRIGYVIVGASGSGWVAGTDALAGGSGGNPASSTVYGSTTGVADTGNFTSVLQITNPAGTVITTTAG